MLIGVSYYFQESQGCGPSNFPELDPKNPNFLILKSLIPFALKDFVSQTNCQVFVAHFMKLYMLKCYKWANTVYIYTAFDSRSVFYIVLNVEQI